MTQPIETNPSPLSIAVDPLFCISVSLSNQRKIEPPLLSSAIPSQKSSFTLCITSTYVGATLLGCASSFEPEHVFGNKHLSPLLPSPPSPLSSAFKFVISLGVSSLNSVSVHFLLLLLWMALERALFLN